MFNDYEHELIDDSLNLENNGFLSFNPNQIQNINLDNPNIINEDIKFNNDYHKQIYFLIENEKTEKNNTPSLTKATGEKTKGKNDGPKLCTSQDILDIFNKESNINKISENFKSLNFNANIEEELQLTRNKKKLDFFEYIDYIKHNDKKEKKRGKKKENINRIGVHDKMCSDNIIKKVKSSIFSYIHCFLNNILNSVDESCSLYHSKLAKLSYKYNDIVKKEKELEMLNMSLKEIFSKEIKLKKYNSNYNKQIVENILNNEKVNDTILFVFNMTLRNWLDIFTLKKSVIEIINEYKDRNYKNIDYEKIEKSWVGVDKLLNEIKEKNDEDYLPYFIICLYNYERWFYLKKTRYNKKK